MTYYDFHVAIVPLPILPYVELTPILPFYSVLIAYGFDLCVARASSS